MFTWHIESKNHFVIDLWKQRKRPKGQKAVSALFLHHSFGCYAYTCSTIRLM